MSEAKKSRLDKDYEEEEETKSGPFMTGFKATLGGLAAITVVNLAMKAGQAIFSGDSKSDD